MKLKNAINFEIIQFVSGFDAIVKLLVENGADINSKSGAESNEWEIGNSALHWAVEKGDF